MKVIGWSRLPQTSRDADRYTEDLSRALNEWQREYLTLNKAIDIPSFRVHLNGTDQTGIVTSTLTKIAFATAGIDTHGYFSTTAYRYTPKIAGTYYIQLCGRFVAWVADSFCTMAIYQNGSAIDATRSTSHTTTAPSAQVSALVAMNGSTDYIEFYAQQDTGSNQSLYGGIPNTFAHGFKVSD